MAVQFLQMLLSLSIVSDSRGMEGGIEREGGGREREREREGKKGEREREGEGGREREREGKKGEGEGKRREERKYDFTMWGGQCV